MHRTLFRHLGSIGSAGLLLAAIALLCTLVASGSASARAGGRLATAPAVQGPSPRFDSAMAYDAAAHTVVLFGGGAISGALNDTWVWNGSTWSQAITGVGCPAACPTSPPARITASLAYFGATGTALLFGGQKYNGIGVLNDTWTWNGSTWSQQSPVTSPSGRYAAGLAYDDATSTLVLFGGEANNDMHDTWVWNGGKWNPACGLSTTPAPPSCVHSLCPAGGLPAGGTSVTLSGSSFTGATEVFFGPTQTTSFSVLSDTTMTETAPAGAAGTTVDVIVTAPGGTSGAASFTYVLQGDANADGAVNAIDALCILRSVAVLPGTLACSMPLQGNADVNGDGKVDSVDALCVLRIVAKLPSTQACPIGTAAAPVESAATSAAGDSTVSGSPVQLRLQPSAVPAPGRQTVVTLTADANGAALGAWTVDIGYDPTSVRILDCAAPGSSVCNTAYAPGIVRVSGVATGGAAAATLATITTETTGAGRTTGALKPIPVTLADSSGNPLAAAAAVIEPAQDALPH